MQSGAYTNYTNYTQYAPYVQYGRDHLTGAIRAALELLNARTWSALARLTIL